MVVPFGTVYVYQRQYDTITATGLMRYVFCLQMGS